MLWISLTLISLTLLFSALALGNYNFFSFLLKWCSQRAEIMWRGGQVVLVGHTENCPPKLVPMAAATYRLYLYVRAHVNDGILCMWSSPYMCCHGEVATCASFQALIWTLTCLWIWTRAMYSTCNLATPVPPPPPLPTAGMSRLARWNQMTWWCDKAMSYLFPAAVPGHVCS